MPRNVDPNLMKLFGPAGVEALVRLLLIEINTLRGKMSLAALTYDSFVQSVLSENADIIIPKDK